MDALLSPDTYLELAAMVWQWVVDNVLVVSNAVQVLVIVATFGISLLLSKRVSAWFDRYRSHATWARGIRIVSPLLLALIWLLLQWLSIGIATTGGWGFRILEIAATLLFAWIAIRLVSQFVQNHVWSTLFVWVAWTIAALSILQLLDPLIAMLQSAVLVEVSGNPISLFTIAQSTLALVVLLSLAVYVTGLIESRIRTSRTLSPSVQVLFVKSLKIVLIGLAILIAIDSVGIDLTALAVFGGAIGVGVGFGLQRTVSNLISGVILLVDKSIKPGDVIAVSGTYGWVTALGGRYVSVVTRDGVEHLIPNETLISERVENWTHTDSQTRLKVDVGVHYESDVHHAMGLCLEAAAETERVIERPAPKCLLIEFGDSSVNLQLRFWIADAHNGVQNVKSAVLLKIWDKFKEHGVEIPYPQRDLHIRSGLPPQLPDQT